MLFPDIQVIQVSRDTARGFSINKHCTFTEHRIIQYQVGIPSPPASVPLSHCLLRPLSLVGSMRSFLVATVCASLEHIPLARSLSL